MCCSFSCSWVFRLQTTAALPQQHPRKTPLPHALPPHPSLFLWVSKSDLPRWKMITRLQREGRWVLEPWLKKKMKVKEDEWGPLTACSFNTDILNADMCACTEIVCLAEMLIYIFPLMSNPPTISHSEMACIKWSTPSPHPQYSFHPTWHLTWCNVWMDERISLAADVILKCSHDLPY